jgi:hypothetical protein
MEFAKTTMLAKERLSRWRFYPFSEPQTIWSCFRSDAEGERLGPALVL